MANDLMYDVMIDTETLGRQDEAVITSIAAVQFNIETGELGGSILINIDIDDCLKHGRVVQGDTLAWWLQQGESARKLIYDNTIPRASLQCSMDALSLWISNLELRGNVRVWGNGASFDLTKIKNSMRAVGRKVPWLFYNERDVRTLESLRPEFKHNEKFTGVKHNPLHDCEHQIKYCVKVYNALNS